MLSFTLRRGPLSVRRMFGFVLLLTALTLPQLAEAKSKPKPKEDKAAKSEIKWIQKSLDVNAGFQLFLQTATGQTTSTEIQTFYTEIITSLTQQKATLDGWLIGWYGQTYVPKPKTLGRHDDDDDDDDDNSTVDILNLDRLIEYAHKLQSQFKEAKKLKHAEVYPFAKAQAQDARDIANVAKAWIKILEAEVENEHEDGDDD